MSSRISPLATATSLRSLLARQTTSNSRPLNRSLSFWQRPAWWEGARYANHRASLASSSDSNTSPNVYAHEYPRGTSMTVNLPALSMLEAEKMFDWLCRRPDKILKMYPEAKFFVRKGNEPSMRFVDEGEDYLYCLIDWEGEAAMQWAL